MGAMSARRGKIGTGEIRAASVHVVYDDQSPCEHVSGCVNVFVEARWTYYCVLQWDVGYVGLQLDGDLFHRQAHFAIWDQPEGKAQVVAKPPVVRADRFGGEGTGVKLRMEYEWQEGLTYEFKVCAQQTGARTLFAASLRCLIHGGKVVPLGTVGLPGNHTFGRVTSFMEDLSPTPAPTVESVAYRACKYSNVKKRSADRVRGLRFAHWDATTDTPCCDRVNAEVRGGWFFLETGGGTQTRSRRGELLAIPPDQW